MNKEITKAVFPATGIGICFLPATKASPKEMLLIVGKPMILYVVEEVVAAGTPGKSRQRSGGTWAAG